ncbi:hypothetical protein DBV39_07390 [Orrella marina]|uniref:Uncharacterized protein n=1 Tax=Orrella marina TaxID=2163011 RepID=A0A2R4XID7_9BURK|nr:hypothetical protein DBV39_07390 [Orrella marina]
MTRHRDRTTLEPVRSIQVWMQMATRPLWQGARPTYGHLLNPILPEIDTNVKLEGLIDFQLPAFVGLRPARPGRDESKDSQYTRHVIDQMARLCGHYRRLIKDIK